MPEGLGIADLGVWLFGGELPWVKLPGNEGTRNLERAHFPVCAMRHRAGD